MRTSKHEQFAEERPKDEEDRDRESWGHSAEFFLSLLGYSVGLGNILRFPYLTMRNGGGAFLLPYFLCLFLCGAPLFLLEVFIGQFSAKSTIICWETFAPIVKGVGYSSMLSQFFAALSYNATIAWLLYYLGTSLTWSTPWSSCNSTWNTENCVVTLGDVGNQTQTYSLDNSTVFLDSNVNEANVLVTNMTGKPMSAAEEYFQYNVLRLSSGIEEIGVPSWQLAVAHIVGWLVIFICLSRGIKSVGKVVWFTALFPYVIITCFLIRAVTLPGSLDGIKFYVTPNFETLKNPEVWVLAFLQIFYTLGPGWGGIITMASYNKRIHNFLIESFLAPIICCLTSFFSGFVVFSCAGFLSHKTGLPIQEAVSSGPGLAFITYPEVTSHLPAGPLWAIMFFFMLFIVALDTQFVQIETIVSCIRDHFNLSKRYQILLLASVSFFCMITGILFLTNSGMYYYQVIDWYFAVVAIFLIAMFECIVLVWFYGHKRIFRDIETMIGPKLQKVKYVLVGLWCVVIPGLLLPAMRWSVINLSKPIYGDYVYPDWAEILGWTLAISLTIPIPLYAIFKVVGAMRNPHKKSAVKALFRPEQVIHYDAEKSLQPLRSTDV